jgi:ParB/RepB/Spo0J family partition protein
MATAIKDAAASTTKSRAKKAPTVQDTTPLAPSTITTVRYADVERATENVRRTDKAADVESLADDIAAHGLLQSLIGYRWPKQIATGPRKGITPICIVGGGRRLQALELLHERGAIDDDWPVPVLIRDRGDAIELSLSENLARRDMNPADEFLAFAALMKPGALSTTDLAKRFGFTERYIKQRLRLAGLAGEILDALREGKLSLEFALEYAKTTDQALQSKVFRAMQRGPAYNRDNLWSIRSALAAEQLTEDSAVFRFIRSETYEEEGGGYVEDLFSDLTEGQGRKLSDGTIARNIANRCLQFQAVRVTEAAKRDYPTVTGFVVSPTLLLDGPTSPPAGYVKIEGGWNSDLGKHVEIKGCWERARDLSTPIHLVVGIERETAIGEDDDGSPLGYVAGYDRARFFVPKDARKQVLPSAERVIYGADPMTPEQREAQELERDARLWAARLAVPRFNSVPGFEDRVFYDRDWLDGHRIKPGDPASGDRTPSFQVNVFVTEAEIAEHLDAGRERAREIREERTRRIAEREAAKEAELVAKGAALATAIETITALPEQPAVIMAAQYDDDEPTAWHRWANGDYFDLPEDDEDADDAVGTDGLEGLFDTMVKVTAWFATRAEYEASLS